MLTAFNGLDGLKAFEQNEKTIDLVITDLVMPEISRVGVISIIKKKYPGTPVIAITAGASTPARSRRKRRPTWCSTSPSS